MMLVILWLRPFWRFVLVVLMREVVGQAARPYSRMTAKWGYEQSLSAAWA